MPHHHHHGKKIGGEADPRDGETTETETETEIGLGVAKADFAGSKSVGQMMTGG
ncbi:hypothetical protein RJZ90_000151 [Blastomyces dermatitidis]